MHINMSRLMTAAHSIAGDIETQQSQSTADGTTPVYWFAAGVGVMAALGGVTWLVRSCGGGSHVASPQPSPASEESGAELFGPGVGKPAPVNFFFPGPGEEDWTMASAIVDELAVAKRKAIALPKERFREFEALEKEAGWLLNSLVSERPKKAAASAAAKRLSELLVEMKKLTEAPEVDVVAR